jgi:chitodextrinase
MKTVSMCLLFCTVHLFAEVIPPKPTNIGVYNITETSARMSFKDLSTNEEGFRVYHNLIKIAEIPLKRGTGTYQYTNLLALNSCTLYTINLLAYNSEGESKSIRKSFRTKGCTPVVPINKRPIIDAGSDKATIVNKEVLIEGTASDSDGTVVSYQWKKGDTVLSDNTSFIYIPQEIGIDILTFIVKDNDGAISSQEIRVVVSKELIEEPPSTNLPKAPINIGAYNFKETSARLSFKDMANNEDGFRVLHNGTILAQIAPKEGEGKYQYKTLENLEMCTLYTVKVTSYNSVGESTPLSKSFKTQGCLLLNKAPIAKQGQNKSITIGDDVLVQGSGVDDDGRVISYQWTKGSEVLSTQATFTYRPTAIGIDTLTLTVTDNKGLTGSNDLKIFINGIDENNAIEAVNIADFNAIPNDNIDDTEAIRNALNVSGSIVMPTGVYIVKDLYREGTTIIDGNGSTFQTTLTNIGTSNNILTLKGDKIKIRGLVLDGNSKTQYPSQGTRVASLLHIYDSKNILLENIFIKDYNSQHYRQNLALGDPTHALRMNNDHTEDMFYNIFISFSRDIELKNIEQENIKIEGPLIYESDNIKIKNFHSSKSPAIWTSLHVVASDNILLENIEVTDGLMGSTGSSINFFANHHFTIKDVNITHKHGLDISNEVDITNIPTGRVRRDTSYGTFENCRFESYHPVQGYPTKNRHEALRFINVEFLPTRVDSGSYAVRFQNSGELFFDNCQFGNPNVPSRFNMNMGSVQKLTVQNSQFINTKFDGNGGESSYSASIYILGSEYGTLDILNNSFSGVDYTPVIFKKIAKENTSQKVKEFKFSNNISNEDEFHYGTIYKSLNLPIEKIVIE